MENLRLDYDRSHSHCWSSRTGLVPGLTGLKLVKSGYLFWETASASLSEHAQCVTPVGI